MVWCYVICKNFQSALLTFIQPAKSLFCTNVHIGMYSKQARFLMMCTTTIKWYNKYEWKKFFVSIIFTW